MSKRFALLVAQPPLTLPWQVAAPHPSLPFLLIGWRTSANREAGVPGAVAQLLIRAFLRLGQLAYLRSSEPPKRPNTCSQQLQTGSVSGRFSALFTKSPGSVWWVVTSEPEVARELFEDAGLPWWMQGQLIVVSKEPKTERLDRKKLLHLLNPSVSLTPADLDALRALAIVRPGVDGDVAAVVARDSTTEQRLLDSLQLQATSSSFDWHLLTEAAFAEAISGVG